MRSSYRRKVVLASALILLCSWGVVVAVVGLAALREARAGRAQLVAAQAAAGREDANGARSAAIEAGSALERVAGKLRSPAIAPLRALPLARRHIHVADALVDAGRLAALATGDIANAIEARPPQGWSLQDGRLDLAAVSAAAAHLRDAHAPLAAARRRVEEAPSTWLVGPVAGLRRQARLDAAVAEETAAHGADGLTLAYELLGAEGGRRRYFLAVANLSELRGTGGFMGFYGVLHARDGKLSFRAFGRPQSRLPAPSSAHISPPPWFVRTYARYGATNSWVNINAPTDFAAVGRTITQALRQPGSLGDVDGVIAVDPVALEAILRSTGPISVPPWPQPIDAANVSKVTQHDAYVSLGGGDPERYDFLADVAEVVFERVADGGVRLNQPTLRELGASVEGGHIQMYATREEEQAVLGDLGLARAVERAEDATDVLGAVTENWGANKVDWFLRRRVDYEVSLDPGDGRAHGRLSMKLENLAPGSGLPGYIIGPNARDQAVPAGHNRQLAVLLRPPSDQLQGDPTVDGLPKAVSADFEGPLRAYTGFVTVPSKDTVTIEADFDVPGGLRGSGRTRTYRLHVLRQPVAHPDRYSVSVVVPKGWNADGPTTFEGPLVRDLVLDVQLTQTRRAWLFETVVQRPFRLAKDMLGDLL